MIRDFLSWTIRPALRGAAVVAVFALALALSGAGVRVARADGGEAERFNRFAGEYAAQPEAACSGADGARAEVAREMPVANLQARIAAVAASAQAAAAARAGSPPDPSVPTTLLSGYNYRPH